MKTVMMCIILCLLAGCFYQTVTNEEIELGQKYCSEYNGLMNISENFAGKTEYRCVSGDIVWESTARLEVYKGDK